MYATLFNRSSGSTVVQTTVAELLQFIKAFAHTVTDVDDRTELEDLLEYDVEFYERVGKVEGSTFVVQVWKP